MHLFVNGLAGTAGGGLTYIRNVIPHLAATPGLRVTIVLPPGLRRELSTFSNVDMREMEMPAARRLFFEQSKLPGLIQESGAEILLSAGNFALRNSPVPQILLSRNSIYTSSDFYRDLRTRHEYRSWMDTRLRGTLAKRSIRWADATVAPSEAFAAELRRWSGRDVKAIHHGFDREAFTRNADPLSTEVEEKLRRVAGSLKLLFVSHYNYYRNFETLLRSLAILRRQAPEREIRLLLTCKLLAGENPGTYDPRAAAKLIKQLAIEDMVVELGSVPYQHLHRLYDRANIYVSPSYTETFAHPLVEAMASGLPVVASDLAVHREICGDAAVYFPRFSPQAMADKILEIAQSPEKRKRMRAAGLDQSRRFSWKRHVEAILELAEQLMKSGRRATSSREGSREFAA